MRKPEVEKHTTIVGDYETYPSVTDKTSGQNISIDIKDSHHTMSRCYLIDIHRKLQSMTSEYRLFFPSAHGWELFRSSWATGIWDPASLIE